MEAELVQRVQHQLDRGEALERLHRYEEACDTYSIAATILIESVYSEVEKDGDSWLLIERAKDGTEIGAFNAARLWKVRESFRSTHLFHIVRYNMGRCLAVLGYNDEARKMFEEAIEFTPDGVEFKSPCKMLARLDQLEDGLKAT